LLDGTGTQRIISQYRGKIKTDFAVAKSMVDALGLAQEMAKGGDIILLSPACASFGMFKNEFDRGDQFKNIVKKLK
jgi:UDP-N-acetylmuramoylalanine--D-glutamate ligase